jgi:hypothetical protein
MKVLLVLAPVAWAFWVHAEPQVELTGPQAGATVSVSHPLVITWNARDIPENAMLSLRFVYVDHVTMTINGQPVVQPVPTTRLITSVMTGAHTRALFESMHATPPVNPDVIERGTYSWNLPAYCPRNTNNGATVCAPGRTFQIEAILRDSGDPCADNETCAQPRVLFKKVMSSGSFTFVE